METKYFKWPKADKKNHPKNPDDRQDDYSWQDADDEADELHRKSVNEDVLRLLLRDEEIYAVDKLSEDEKIKINAEIFDTLHDEFSKTKNESNERPDSDLKNLLLIAHRTIEELDMAANRFYLTRLFGKIAKIKYLAGDEYFDISIDNIANYINKYNQDEEDDGDEQSNDDFSNLCNAFTDILLLKIKNGSPYIQDINKIYLKYANDNILLALAENLAKQKNIKELQNLYDICDDSKKIQLNLKLVEFYFESSQGGDKMEKLKEIKSQILEHFKDIDPLELDQIFYKYAELAYKNGENIDEITSMLEAIKSKYDQYHYFSDHVYQRLSIAASNNNIDQAKEICFNNIGNIYVFVDTCKKLVDIIREKQGLEKTIEFLEKALKKFKATDGPEAYSLNLLRMDLSIYKAEVNPSGALNEIKKVEENSLKDGQYLYEFFIKKSIILAKINDPGWKDALREAWYYRNYNDNEATPEFEEVEVQNLLDLVEFAKSLKDGKYLINLIIEGYIIRKDWESALILANAMRNLNACLDIAEAQFAAGNDSCYLTLNRCAGMLQNEWHKMRFLKTQSVIDPKEAFKNFNILNIRQLKYDQADSWTEASFNILSLYEEKIKSVTTVQKREILLLAIENNDRELILALGNSISVQEKDILLQGLNDEARTIIDHCIFSTKKLDEESYAKNLDYYKSLLLDKIQKKDTQDLFKDLGMIFKDLEKNTPENQPRISEILYGIINKVDVKNPAFPMLINMLLNLDDHNAHRYAFYLSGKVISKNEDQPYSAFCQIMENLIEKKYLSENLLDYIYENAGTKVPRRDNILILKDIINRYPSEFSSTIDSLDELGVYSLADNREEILASLKYMGAVIPVLYKRFCAIKDENHFELERKRKKFGEDVNLLKQNFFKNKPVSDLCENDPEVLEEMIYITFKPVNMDLKNVKDYLKQLDDNRTEAQRIADLKSFVFPENGYEISLAPKEERRLKRGETIPSLSTYYSLLKTEFSENNSNEISEALKKISLGNLVNSQKSISGKVAVDQYKHLRSALSLLSRDDRIKSFLSDYSTPHEMTYSFLAELNEILTVYLEDNYERVLGEFLDKNPEVEKKLITTLESNKGNLFWSTIKGARKKSCDIDKNRLNRDLDFDREHISQRQTLTRLIKEYLKFEILKYFDIPKELKKFEGVKKISLTTNKLKAYISKNNASFFAKASAGICTSGDIGLYNMPNHFHINTVEDDKIVQGNTQAYIIDHPAGKKSLLLRGFNPNSKFCSEIDVQIYCEEILRIGKQFVKDNNLSHLYITGQEDTYHALSNRAEPADYLSKYLTGKNQVNVDVQISTKMNIFTIYRIN